VERKCEKVIKTFLNYEAVNNK